MIFHTTPYTLDTTIYTVSYTHTHTHTHAQNTKFKIKIKKNDLNKATTNDNKKYTFFDQHFLSQPNTDDTVCTLVDPCTVPGTGIRISRVR